MLDNAVKVEYTFSGLCITTHQEASLNIILYLPTALKTQTNTINGASNDAFHIKLFF